MTHPIRLCLVLHNHQPIGNFQHVFEQAYQDSYRPFLDTFEPYDHLRISLHTSGPLFEWLEEHHPDYLDRLAALAARGRVEIIGGAYYEPILTMIPARDRVGQIRSFTGALEARLSAEVGGMWIPERVWEQSLASDLADAGIRYTVLDDFHFRNAGIADAALNGYYLTEDDGRVLRVFPGSERLRYLIPFAQPEETIHYLRKIADQFPRSVIVFGDDGEKFGSWPETRKHVYDNGWLRQFFDHLTANRSWLETGTLADAVAGVAPVGRVYLPDSSYREMTEWSLPAARQVEYEQLRHEFEHDERWSRLRRFIRGGFWRNFKVKYSEANDMYARMMMVSARLDDLARRSDNDEPIAAARRALYRAQCNCSYWHGAFGGIYLPHLRNAVYQQLILADTRLDEASGRNARWVEATVEDYNFDTRPEVRLANDHLVCLVAPAAGGQLYELDVRSIAHNLLATLMRRPEVYHRRVLAGENAEASDVASIHDRVVFKQAALDERLQYDPHPRRSLMDRFMDLDTPLSAVERGEASERGDFVDGVYETRLRRNPDRIQIQLTRDGHAFDLPIRITKGLTAAAGSSTLEIAYLLEGLPSDRQLHFGVEFNFAGLPAGADDRFFYGSQRERLGRLESRLDLDPQPRLGLVDQWLGIDIELSASTPTRWWTYPVETVSQSEGGFELVHQSVAVVPHWIVSADRDGRWSVTLRMGITAPLDGSSSPGILQQTSASA